jgi:hypothetical protein
MNYEIIPLISNKYNYSDQVKEDAMGKACNTNWRRGMHIGYSWESQKERDQAQIPRRRWVGNIKMDLRERGWVGMDWVVLAEDRDQWRALVNTVMNLRVP